MRLLLIDDDVKLATAVARGLVAAGFAVEVCHDGGEGLWRASEGQYDLIVLDLMLPGVDGLTLTRQLRTQKTADERHRLPIIMLTAKGETSDRIRGLDLGADDYLAKPFSPQELVSRVKAVLRRAGADDAAERAAGQSLEFDGLRLEPASRTVTRDGEVIPLTTKEFDLLWFFARHPRQVFTRTQLLDHIWGYEFYGDPSTVTVHIRRLREKIERDPSQPRYLLTVWGVGYKFEG